jgi:Lrp/AsnC family leucine-responsive transcriptional regulator
MELDITDINILKVLQENGRLSFRQIAERVKVSVPTVSTKVGNMENVGIITSYTAVMDSEKMGSITIIMTIRTKPSDMRKVSEQFVTNGSVRHIFVLSNGKLQLICTFPAHHMINDFITRLAEIPEIIEYDIANIVSVVKEEPRAIVSHDSSVVLQCGHCKKDMHDDTYRVRRDDRDYYVCCPVCQKGFESKYDQSRSESVRSKV